MYDHRLTDRLTNYWENLRRGQPMPEFAHLNASALGELWQQCILFTVSAPVPGQKQTLSFTMIGDKLRELYGSDVLGKAFIPPNKHFQGAAIVRKADTILEHPAPLIDIGQFISERNKVVKYRSCLLPFGKQHTVTHILAGLSWKEY
jgi:hypothetical protein